VYFLDTNVKESGDGVEHAGQHRLFRKLKTPEEKVKQHEQKQK